LPGGAAAERGGGGVNTLVTGGAGYIGSHLADALRRDGQAVRVLDARRPGAQSRTGSTPDYVHGSIADHRATAQAVQGIDVVVHLAWGFHPGDEGRELRENLLGTFTLLEAALAAGVQHFLFASSAVVYGPTGPARVNEEHPCYPERGAIGGPMYGIAKLACEKLCLVFQRRGLPVTVFRLHGVFSEGRLGQFGHMIERARSGELVRVVREAGGEYLHLEDAISAFLLAGGNPQAHGQVFNLAGTHTYREAELARLVVEVAGTGSRLEWVDDPALGMISVSAEKACRLLGIEYQMGDFLTPLIRRAVGA
jgi:UDP-glucose 4-epimerase